MASVASDRVVKMNVSLTPEVVARLASRMSEAATRSGAIRRDLERLYSLYTYEAMDLREMFTPYEQRYAAEAWQAMTGNTWMPGALRGAVLAYRGQGKGPSGSSPANVAALLAGLSPLQELTLVDACERWLVAGKPARIEPLGMSDYSDGKGV